MWAQMQSLLRYLPAAWLVIAGALVSSPSFASSGEIDSSVDAAFTSLYQQSPTAKDLAQSAKGILVFPKSLGRDHRWRR